MNDFAKEIARTLHRLLVWSLGAKISMQKAGIHFEQISVETVKKIATEHPHSSSIGNDACSCEARDERMSFQEEWRQLAQQVQQEQDPQRLLHLMKQLLNALEEEKLRKLRPRRSHS